MSPPKQERRGQTSQNLQRLVNEALRTGFNSVLPSPSAKPYRIQLQALDMCDGFSYHNVSKLLARAEGADHK